MEVYLLGELPAAEQAEVETMAARHAEVRDELSRIEATYAALANQLPVTPRPGLRDEILAKVTGDTAKTSVPAKSAAQPDVAQPNVARPNVARPSAAQPSAAQTSESRAPQAKQRRLLPWQLGVAASLLIAVLSAAAAWHFRGEWKEAEQQLQLAQAQNQEIASQYETASQRSERLENDLSVVSSPEYQAIALAGTDVSPESTARVFWNAGAEQLYLSPGNLPEPPTDKQYQLWAIVDGAPVSAGVFEVTPDDSSLQTLSSQIAQASAFAITLEPRGGSPSPTMEAMYVQGAVADS
ncbi:MAG: anti-sigma factor [Tunicatimonas sp.]